MKDYLLPEFCRNAITFENVSFMVSIFSLRVLGPLDTKLLRTGSGVNVSYVKHGVVAAGCDAGATSSLATELDRRRSPGVPPSESPPEARPSGVFKQETTSSDFGTLILYRAGRTNTTLSIRKYSTGLSLAVPGSVK